MMSAHATLTIEASRLSPRGGAPVHQRPRRPPPRGIRLALGPFELGPYPRDKALDVFDHPYSYAASRSLPKRTAPSGLKWLPPGPALICTGGYRRSLRGCPRRSHSRQLRMEPLWSPAVATHGNRWQMARPLKQPSRRSAAHTCQCSRGSRTFPDERCRQTTDSRSARRTL
jgi:hypothetical protein